MIVKGSRELRGFSGVKRALAALGLVAGMITQVLPQAAAPARVARLSITGAVERPLDLQISDLEKMPYIRVDVKNHDGTFIAYEGVVMAELLKSAGAPIGEKLRGANMASYILAGVSGRIRLARAGSGLHRFQGVGPVHRERKALARRPGTLSDRRATRKARRPLDSNAPNHRGRENSVVS